MKTFAIVTLGCKVNDYEATYIRELMKTKYLEVNFKDKADIYIIFSCCVTNMAEAKTRKYINRVRKENPDSYICVVGCLSQIQGHTPLFENIDLVVGSDQKDKIVELIAHGVHDNLVKDKISSEFENLYLENYPNKSRAFLKIQDGCNQFCSYCIIPYARGQERSGKYNVILEQATKLAKTRKEIVLTGIHTGRYNDGEHNLYDLLEVLTKIEALETIRLSSIEMTEISDEIISLIKRSNNKIAHHLHIPVQTCANEVLKAMRRPYSIEEYISRINYIRENIPDISISTDLIVGFPGETDELFNETLDNIKKIKFSFIHVFPYSRKKGTLADKLDNHVDVKIKKERIAKLNAIQNPLTIAYQKSFINKAVEVLVEKVVDGFSYGYTKEYIYTKINGCFDINSIIKAKIILVKENEVIAEYVS